MAIPIGSLLRTRGQHLKENPVLLAGNEYKQPIFYDLGTHKFIYAEYVTLDDGTGVHLAPGHGVDDYNAGVRF